jgi:hypothetical protein
MGSLVVLRHERRPRCASVVLRREQRQQRRRPVRGPFGRRPAQVLGLAQVDPPEPGLFCQRL